MRGDSVPAAASVRATGGGLAAADRRVLALLLVAALAYYACYFNRDLNPSDEGYLCYGALRVANGDTPGADFHAYEPLRYWVLAATFAAFGTDVVVERGLHLLLRLLICALVYAVARLYLAIPLAAASTLVILLVPGPWHKSWFTLCMLTGFLLAERYARRPRRLELAAMGLSCGVAVLVRLDAGAFTAFLGALAILGAPTPAGSRLSTGIRRGLGFALPAMVPLAAAAAWLSARGTLLPALRFYAAEYAHASSTLERIHPKIAGFPSLLDSVRKLPADLFELMIWLSMLSVVLLVTAVLVRWRRTGASALPELRLAAAWGLSFFGVAVQPDRPHFLQQAALLAITAAVALTRCEESFGPSSEPVTRSGGGRISLAVFVALAAVFVAENLFGPGVDPYYTGSISMRRGAEVPFDHPRASLVVSRWIADEYHPILRFIEANTEPGDGVASAFCLPMFNFLSDRPNPTGLDVLFPHTIGSAEQQRRYVAALGQVRLFVANTCELDGRHPAGCPPGDHTLADFAPVLVDHLRREWQPVFRSPNAFVTIYAHRRTGAPLPADAAAALGMK